MSNTSCAQTPGRPLDPAKAGALLLLASFLGLGSCGVAPVAEPLVGSFAGQQVSANVDSPVARYYVENYLKGERRRPEWDAALDGIHARLGGRVPTGEELAEWSRDHSTDLATLVLALQLFRQAEQLQLYTMFREELSAVFDAQNFGLRKPLDVPSDLLYLFVPGWLYRSDTTTGADFAPVRSLLSLHGARVSLAQTAENASVEDNANLIANLIRTLAAQGQQVVVVSASKGGPEAALALSLLQGEVVSQAVRAWINIGGLLRGTALADLGLTWPVRWFVQLAVLPDGSFDGVRSLSLAHSGRRWREIRLPEHLLVVTYLGIPLSGQVSDQARAGYDLLRDRGPNDGLTLVTDAIAPTGITIPEFGVDHYFRRSDMDLRSLALTKAVGRYLTQRNAGQRPPGIQAGTFMAAARP